MLLPVLLSACAVAVAPAAAQERARLRAGEHGDFSRIALDVPRLEAWEIDVSGRIATLSFPDRELTFDTRPIFPERRVSRVTSARSERDRHGTRLVLSLSCSCSAEAYEFQPGMLVIDVRARETQASGEIGETDEPPSDAGHGRDGAHAAAGAERHQEPAGGHADRRGASASPHGAPARDRPPAATAGAIIADADASHSRQTDLSDAAPAVTAGSEVAAEEVSIAEAQRRLLEQLARAADQGLVSFRRPREPLATPLHSDEGVQEGVDPSDRETGGEHGASDPEPVDHELAERARESEVEAPDDMPSPAEAQLEARTAFDRDRLPDPRRRAAVCPDDRLLDPSEWVMPDDPYAELATLRGRMMEEFDRPDPKVVLELARLQTGLGFGAEARQTLAAFGPRIKQTDLLFDLAHVVDGEPPATDGPLAQASGCAGRAGLWRLAGGFTPADGALEDPVWINAVLDAFAELPLHLRRLAGPRLIESLVDEGALDIAEQARLRLDRAPGDHGDAWRFAIARLALARGETDKGEALLQLVAETGGAESPEAMLRLADSLLGRRDTLPEWLVEDIALAAFAHQGTELGRRLLVAEILGRAGRRQLGAALEVIATEIGAGGARSGDLEAAVRAILERARAEDSGPAAYAEAVLAHRGLLGDSPAYDPARAQVTRQLAGIGLANAARRIIDPALARNAPEARLAAAQAEIALDESESALVHLEGLDGEAAAELRARAHAAAGRYASAFEAIAPMLPPTSPERTELAWRAGRWEAVTALPRTDLRLPLAAWMAGREGAAPPSTLPEEAAPFLGPDDLGETPSLAGARAAIERAEALRTRLSAALGGV